MELVECEQPAIEKGHLKVRALALHLLLYKNMEFRISLNIVGFVIFLSLRDTIHYSLVISARAVARGC